LTRTTEGKVDILIGTHRIVSKDIKFKDLGLLIIDEEQKFGVSTKEKLKQFRANVDTLTLTATPIPRTLHFSLMGARDLSIINTPPPNRQPVNTELHVFNEKLIQEAIEYEIDRGGQVFFIHNRVQDIMHMAGLIQKLCPSARIGVGHGQLEGDQLEDVMLKFMSHEFDVLIATTIIESGLDISNANTMIINNAHYFGLSDLHQMRGRVGRSNKKAFCYLLSPPLSVITPEARKRLSAIEEFSDLGSGFNVAMRDLDIRGAGNLLGSEQSGFIAEIGFEMYQKILDEAIKELKRSEFKELFKEEIQQQDDFVKDCSIDTDLEILIPDTYVESITERLSLYSRLDNCETETNLSDFHIEMTDRFGPIPASVEDLFITVRCRKIAVELGFEKMILKNDTLKCFFVSNPDSPYFQSEIFNGILQFLQKETNKAKLKQVGKNGILVVEEVENMASLFKFLHRMKSFIDKKI
jgi:transcription-repair coupling factor (superfamily II helicase)